MIVTHKYSVLFPLNTIMGNIKSVLRFILYSIGILDLWNKVLEKEKKESLIKTEIES